MSTSLIRLLTGTALSFLVFCTLSFLTVLKSVWWSTFNFRLDIGFPLPYYYQFLVEGEVRHGTNVVPFWIDGGLIWLVVTGAYWLMQRRKSA